MSYKYKYTGKGVITIYVGEKQYTLGGPEHPNIPSTVELPRKVDRDKFELISEKKEKSKIKKIESIDSEVKEDDE